MLDFAQEYATAIDWGDLAQAKQVLEKTNALIAPELAEERGLRLLIPSR
ncbi:MAG: hypothetical protein WB507_06580 [Solirubrobacterales bacterium]